MKQSQKLKHAWFKSNQPSMIALEQRMLFDGVVAAPVAATKSAPALQPEASALLALTKNSPVTAPSAVNQVVFVDSRSGAFPAFDVAPSSSVDVVWVDSTSNGIQQITDYLASHQNVSLLALAGETDLSGQVWLGTSQFSASALSSEIDRISQWGSKLSASPQIDLVQLDSNLDISSAEGALSDASGINVKVTDLSIDQNSIWHLATITNNSQADSVSELIFADANAINAMQIAELSKPGVEVVLLNPGEDGLSQIASISSAYADLAAIHIIASSSNASFNLGSTNFVGTDLSSRSNDVVAIAQTLQPDGVIDLYVSKSDTLSAERQLLEKVAAFDSQGRYEARQLVAADPALDGGLHEVVFLDSNVANWEQLASFVRPGVEVVLIDGQGDGLREMADYLGGQSNINAIHIVSHGNPAELFFGSLDLTIDSLSNYADDLSAIGNSLVQGGGDILLYGCYVGEGVQGQSFINAFALASGAHVAASADLTGPSNLGGNWTLEASSGVVLSAAAFDVVAINGYVHDLGGSYTATTGTNVDTSGSTSGLIGAGKLITFNAVTITAASSSALLVLKAYDVDYGLLSNGVPYAIGNANSEWDGVYIQKSGAASWQFVGYLNGTNNTWSTTTLDITTFIKAQGAGDYIVRVVPDDNGTQTQANNGGRWVVGVSSAQILIDGGSGTYTLTSIAETNAAVSSVVTVPTTGTYTVEYNLINSAGQDIASLTKTGPITQAVGTTVAGNLILNSNFYSSSATWSSVPSGTYSLQVTLLDANGVVRASATLPYNVVTAASIPSSGIAALVTGLDAASWTGSSVADLQHTATTDTSPNIVGQISAVASTTATTYVDVYADGSYVGTASVAANSKAWSMQFGAASNLINQTTRLLDPGNHTFRAIYSTTAVASTAASYTVGGSYAVLDAAISIVGSTTPSAVYVSINSGVTGDILAATTGSKFTFTASPTGYYTLTAASGQTPSIADYQAALRSITFHSSATDPTNAGANLSRTISWQIKTGTTSALYSAVRTTTVTVIPVITAPVLTSASSPSTTDYNNSGAISATGGMAIKVADNKTTLASATVGITTNFVSGVDQLGFTNNSSSLYGNITSTYNSGTGVLSLASSGGTATLLQWANALSSVTYLNSDTSGSRSTATRTLSFQANNGEASSNLSTVLTASIAVSRSSPSLAPILAGANQTTVASSGVLYPVVPSLMIFDGDSTHFASATMTVASTSSRNVLAFTNTSATTYGNIAASYNSSSNVLTLTSSGSTATTAQWQAALRAVTYSRTSTSTSTRTVSIVLNDGANNSNTFVSTFQFGSSSSTFTSTTHSVSSSYPDTIDIGSGSVVSQTTSFSTAAPSYALLIDSASSVAPNIIAVDGDSGLTTTADRSPVLSGTAAAGVVLEIKNGATVIGSVTTNSDGTWSFSLVGVQSLVDGNYTFTARDTINNLTDTFSFAVLSPLPTITVSNIGISADTGSSPSDFVTATAVQTITATLSATLPSGSFLQGSVDGGLTWTDVTNKVSGTAISWNGATLTTGYADSNYNKYTIQFRVGNTSGFGSVAMQDYLLYGSLGNVSITSVAYPSASQPTVIGTADPHGVVTISYVVSGVTHTGTATPDTGGNWSFTTPTPLANGTYTFTATETDPVTGANATPVSNTTTITIDTTLPTISGIGISADTGVNATDIITYTSSQTITATLSKVLISGQALLGSVDGGITWTDVTNKVSGVNVSWNGVTLTGGVTGATTIDGSNLIEFQAKTLSTGAQGSLTTLSYVLDTTAPLDYSAVLDPINNTITLTFTETGSGFNTTVVPATSAFTITDLYNGGAANSANGGATYTITPSAVSIASPTTVVLSFAGISISALDSLSVDYVQPLSGNQLQDIAGNKVVTFDPPVYNPISILAVADTAVALEAGGVNNATSGTDPVGNVLSNDAGASLTVNQITAGVTSTAVNPGTSYQSGAAGADGTYGILSIGSDGSFQYVVDNTLAAVQALTSLTHLTDTFTYQAIDGSGNVSTATLTITINGANDAAVVSGATTGSVTEKSGVSNGTAGTATATGTLTDTDVDNTANTFAAVASATASSGGYGTYTIDASGHWSYTLDDTNAAVQALNVGQTLTDTFTVATADGTQQVVTITINGANDAAVISGTSTGSVTEASGVSNAITGTPTATGTLTDTDIDNTANTFSAVSSATTSTGGYGTYTIDAGGHWSYTVSNSNATVQALNVGQTLTDTFTVATVDGTQKVVTITINGANDAAVVGGTSTGSVTEKGGVSNGISGTATATGTLTDTDVDNTANTFTAVGSATTSISGYGTYTIDSGGHWSYTLDDTNAAVQALNVSQTLTDTFTVATADGTQQVVTITINGANDAPVGSVITSLSASEGTAITPKVIPAFTDVDNTAGQLTYSATLSGGAALSTIGLSFNASTRTLSGTPTAGSAGTQTIVVTGTDSGSLSATSSFTMTIVAAGTVMSSDDSASATEASGLLNAIAGTNPSGNVLTNDTGPSLSVDKAAVGSSLGLTPTVVTSGGVTLTGAYGSLLVAADGSYTYSVDNANSTVQALNAGSSPLTDAFTYEALGNTGHVSTATLTITINGANDAAVVSGATTGSVTEKSGVSNGTAGTATATGTLTDTDVDNTANTFAAVASATASSGGYGTYTIDASGHWSYTLDDTNAAVQALNVGQTLTDTFTVATADGTQQVVTITINGANDAAVISGTSTGSVTEASGVSNAITGTPTATGTLTDTDIDNTANTFSAVSSATTSTGGYGTYTIDAGGHWSYTVSNSNATVQALNVGQTLTDTFTVATVDGTQKVVTITINGANDAAVVGGTSTGSVTESINLMTVSTSGTLADSDVDNTANTFTPALVETMSSNGYGTYTIDASGNWNFTLSNSNPTIQALNVGQFLTDTFTVTTADGTQKVVTITINGANDAAAISGTVAGSVLEAGGVNNATAGIATVTGTLTDTDIDNTPNAFTAISSAASTHGTYSIDSSGHWSYTLNDSDSQVQALNDHQTLADTFTVTTIDGTQQVVTITINGANDAAVAPNISNETGIEDVAITPKVIPAFMDVDNSAGQLTYSATLSGGAALSTIGLSFDSATRTISGTPLAGSAGVYHIAVTATDPGGESATATYTVTVNSADSTTTTVAVGPQTYPIFYPQVVPPSSGPNTFDALMQVEFIDLSGEMDAWGRPILKDKDRLNLSVTPSQAQKSQFVKASLANTALNGPIPLPVASPQAPDRPAEKATVVTQAGLRNTLTPPDAVPSVSGQVNYDLPRGTFTGGHGALTLVATQKDGAPLPTWVKFDAATGKVTADVPATMQTPLDIKIHATDSKGDKAETNLKIKPLAPRPQSFTGKPPLSAQIESIVRLVA
ncbi:VCBS domain-containing protein [Polynucleobacter sp. JS-JIR-II-50]|uniref:VCBS domain-containing protein n=1 Tax=Polynucleobacter sp. JS-JIR-II-50 TaxID=2576919 RepID=UPI001BFCE381|nr:VCBS domain-containing protein [Polynucleobacter sp. JS-JIR-II-50]QWE03739.1 DUF4347 domain-containing protein [Polynucleobacter sp. JS-JIR-II-50]